MRFLHKFFVGRGARSDGKILGSDGYSTDILPRGEGCVHMKYMMGSLNCFRGAFKLECLQKNKEKTEKRDFRRSHLAEVHSDTYFGPNDRMMS